MEPKPINPWRFAFVLTILGCIIWYGLTAWKNSQRMTPQKYASLVTEDKGILICFSPTPVDVASRMHHEGRLWVVTKVVLQNTDSWLAKNRTYYAAHPGPRTEFQHAVMIEAPPAEPDGRLPEYFAVFGLPLDGP